MNRTLRTERPAPAAGLQRIVLPVGGKTARIGRASDCDITIDDPTISRHHASLDRDEDAWVLTDHSSKFGTTVGGATVLRKSLSPGQVIRFGHGPRYRFTGEALDSMESIGEGMSVSVRDLTVSRESGNKVLLNRISVDVPAGEFVGVLGPSGVGKSLLINCFSGDMEPTDGEVLRDGEPVNQKGRALNPEVADVPQDDLLYSHLTVHESLDYALRIRSASDREERRYTITRVLARVDLAEHGGQRIDRLSGGQRKRVSIALGLLLRPRLLVVDEPTSGLDPGTGAGLIDTLRKLRNEEGTTVICSTHRTDDLPFFDSVIVLRPSEQGAVVAFAGPPERLLSTFGVRTIADLFRKWQAEPGESPQCSASPETPAVGDHASDTGSPTATTRATRSATRRTAVTTGWGVQVTVSLLRTLTGLWRDPVARGLVLVQPLILAFLGLLTQGGQRSPVFVHFFLVVSAIWLGMTLTIREIVRERRLYARDRNAGLAPGAYLFGKLAFASLVVAVQAALLVGAARLLMPWMVENPNIRHYLLAETPLGMLFLGLLLTGLGGAVIGLTVSTLSRTQRTAVGLLPLLLLPQAFISRVSCGDGLLTWDKEGTPFVRAADIPKMVGNGTIDVRDAALLVASLPLLSRFGTAAVDMLNVSSSTSDAALEWLLLILLLLLHLLVLLAIFRRRQEHWRLDER